MSEKIAHIHNLSHDGRGVANVDGKTIFLFGALPGETVKFEYTKKRSKFDEGIITEIIVPSPQRTAAECPHFNICGGCSFQHLSHQSQIEYKQKILFEILEHQAHISPEQLLAPLSGTSWGYRRKARISTKFVAKKNKVVIGFHERNSRYIADLGECHVLHPSVGKKIHLIANLLEQMQIKHHIPQLEIAIDDQHTAIVLRHMVELPEEDKNLLIDFAKTHHYKIYLQAHGPDTIELFYPKNSDPLLAYSLSKYQLTFQFHPTQFVQIHAEMNEKMIDQALELLDLSPQDRVLDLFCGIGNFTLPIAKFSSFVTGVEGDTQAVLQAKANANINKISNVEFYCSNLFDSKINSLWVNQSYDKILLDPPRSGAKEIIPWISKIRPQRIVYVSCNPATLARDAKLLIDSNYRFVKAGMMDMFPHTQHIEAMSLFERKD